MSSLLSDRDAAQCPHSHDITQSQATVFLDVNVIETLMMPIIKQTDNMVKGSLGLENSFLLSDYVYVCPSPSHKRLVRLISIIFIALHIVCFYNLARSKRYVSNKAVV